MEKKITTDRGTDLIGSIKGIKGKRFIFLGTVHNS
jgi:hypothetical protein